ncbi:hypothetical protein ME7_01167 [Bartonella birtlesii LL-WM9]|uniref:Uncharacterized protein n=1 Tax=Bartonella birtlesii LL-WM9 TaxID=1094552 RepID=J0YNF4_9HYPH|nr:hypothetical protein ME7_01167 [Bartonella birtlesii LL-WM9]
MLKIIVFYHFYTYEEASEHSYYLPALNTAKALGT